MDSNEFKARTRAFAVSIIFLVEKLPRTVAGNVVTRQLVKSGTSVGANYRAACLARSKAEMEAKLQIVQEEADEAIYWMEVARDGHMLTVDALQPHIAEATEIFAMIAASLKTLKSRRNRPPGEA